MSTVRVIGRLSGERNVDAHDYRVNDPDVRSILQRKADSDLAIRQFVLRNVCPEDRKHVLAILLERRYGV